MVHKDFFRLCFFFLLKKILNEEKYYHSFWDKWMDKVFANILKIVIKMMKFL